MNLDQIYQNQVPRTRVSSVGLPEIERDPMISNLEKNVFQQIRDIMPKEPETPINNQKSIQIRTVSFEEALKELFELSKK